MNGLDSMTRKIIGDAESYADEIKKESGQKIEAMLLEYQSQADAVKRELAADAQNEAAMIRERAQSQAALTERNELLRAKREVIDLTFSTACDMIVDLPKDEYVGLLARLVARYQTGPAEIILNERDATAIGAELLKKIVMNKIRSIDITMIKISKTCGKFRGGLILRQGDIDTNCTVEVLCEGLRHQLEAQVIEQLDF